MENDIQLAELSPAHSRSSRASSSVHAHEIPELPQPPAYDDSDDDAPEQESRTKSPIYGVIVLAVIAFLMQLGVSMFEVPSIQRLEDLICHEYYDHKASGDPIPEGQCTVAAVQGELNFIVMGSLILGYVAVAIPSGILAEKQGGGVALLGCAVGMLSSRVFWTTAAWNPYNWSLRYVWVSAAGRFFGGSDSMAQSILFAMVEDIAPLDKRGVYFGIQIFAMLLGETLGPFIASAMMLHSIFTPLIASPSFILFGALFIGLLRQQCEKPEPQGEQTVAGLNTSTLWSRFYGNIRSIWRGLGAWRLRNILATASLTIPAARVMMSIALRYIHLRFGWTITQAGMALGVRTGLSILVMFVFRPALGGFLNRIRGGWNRDLMLARISVMFLLVGQCVFAAAGSMPMVLVGLTILTLGTGAPSLSRAIVMQITFSGSMDSRSASVAMWETSGYLVYGVILAAVNQFGIEAGLQLGSPSKEGWALALVFWVSAGVYILLVVMRWSASQECFQCDVRDLERVPPPEGPRACDNGVCEARVLADDRASRGAPGLEGATVSP
ncbi:hypothetical protein M406DRAFT_72971 [Cryphonectria parasitica EP155]|uniref:Major facilitator superfamily (MFS) profile domain-containing protein n=1 Tax=Cryphonectria parasitica (strain ATCC 38755 / EP155) TaxID=660469 RepID=A0A9P4XTG6_CRYP1|nr:uncharacterized protein M406DRAFT_72971 [Cryphonectria parasitica EP155]KAF3760480.1 hypothetical protein M406DRAFT_72971 [Cryphonectria parasitica EP155]